MFGQLVNLVIIYMLDENPNISQHNGRKVRGQQLSTVANNLPGGQKYMSGSISQVDVIRTGCVETTKS
ncbi:unnamed protein product [Bursaphelenchus xylophilus]|uniref:(pine wood nematode) hypothetical protein n=1 Tax=Bursaphelenchus xylophilus TaxID=6326 RepID=A0A7I8WT18_BURXY|nr:unnamed protein product [Bursaphelenchus xylophilus]CAG9115735.1 unnamed protein product [Bursaphelenchus xylophilus]